MKAKIIEIFSSIQGEGLWVGRPQIFVRFHGCRLKCGYCDTPLTHHKITQARIEYPPFSRKFEYRDLSFSADELDRTIARFGIPSLALTGGEPLEQAEFIEHWLRSQKYNYEILIETNGVETESLKKILRFSGMVSLDIKIPSATGEGPLWDEHDRFLETVQGVPHYAKVVYHEGMLDDEVERLRVLMRRHANLKMVFQPVSPIQKRDFSRCLALFRIFAESFPERVRLIPQVHKSLGIL